nr:hypothetical protein [Tanacetum cinerariifolium]
MNISPENRANFEAEKEAIHLILTGIGDKYTRLLMLAKQLRKCGKLSKGYNKPEWSRFVTIVKQQHKLDEVSYHKLFDILKQYQNEVNELRAERLARNVNPLALVATTQANQDPYYQASRDKDMQKNLALIAKYFKKIYKPTNNNLRTSSNFKNKNVDTTPRKFTSHDGETMESYYTRFYKLMNEMIQNNLTVATMQVNVQFLQQLQPEWSRFVTIVKQQHKMDEVSYYKLFDILKQNQKEVNELHAEILAMNASPLALVATTQANQDPYYQTSKSQKSYAPSSKPSTLIRSHTTTRYKGKEIAKQITPPSESASKEDSDPEQAQRDKDMQKNLALIAKYFKRIYKPTNNNLRTSSNSRNKNVDTTPWENVGSSVVQQSGIQCFNYKEFGHFAKECRKPKRVKDSTSSNFKNKNVDTTPRFKNDNQSGQFGNQRMMNVAGARENVGSPVVQQSVIQCFNYKKFRHFAKKCKKPKRVKDSAYHKEKILLCKQAE